MVHGSDVLRDPAATIGEITMKTQMRLRSIEDWRAAFPISLDTLDELLREQPVRIRIEALHEGRPGADREALLNKRLQIISANYAKRNWC